MPFRMAEEETVAVIKVIGVGGGGGNAINTMVESRLAGVQLPFARRDVFGDITAPAKPQPARLVQRFA